MNVFIPWGWEGRSERAKQADSGISSENPQPAVAAAPTGLRETDAKGLRDEPQMTRIQRGQ